MHLSSSFKRKMADGTLRDGNERGLYNFIESLRTLLIGIQNLNTQDASVDYVEQANLRLEDAILTLQLLLYSVWQKLILKLILRMLKILKGYTLKENITCHQKILAECISLAKCCYLKYPFCASRRLTLLWPYLFAILLG